MNCNKITCFTNFFSIIIISSSHHHNNNIIIIIIIIIIISFKLNDIASYCHRSESFKIIKPVGWTPKTYKLPPWNLAQLNLQGVSFLYLREFGETMITIFQIFKLSVANLFYYEMLYKKWVYHTISLNQGLLFLYAANDIWEPLPLTKLLWSPRRFIYLTISRKKLAALDWSLFIFAPSWLFRNGPVSFGTYSCWSKSVGVFLLRCTPSEKKSETYPDSQTHIKELSIAPCVFSRAFNPNMQVGLM